MAIVGKLFLVEVERFWQRASINKSAHFSARIPPALRTDVERLCDAFGVKRSVFYRRAIDAAASVGFNVFFQAYTKLVYEGRLESVYPSVTDKQMKHLDLLKKMVKAKLQTPRRARKKTRSDKLGSVVLAPTPNRSKVFCASLKMYADTFPPPVKSAAELERERAEESTFKLTDNPILICGDAVPAEVLRRLKPLAGMLADFNKGKEFLHFIDATALFAATVRIPSLEPNNGSSPRDSASRLTNGVLTAAKHRKFELFIFRSEVTRYCQMLHEALSRSCAGTDLIREEVVIKGRLALSSVLKIVEVEPLAVFQARSMPDSVAPHLKLMVAQMNLMAVDYKVLVVSCSQELVGVSDKVLVWHPNDLPLSLPPTTKSEASEGTENKPNGLMINNRPPNNKPRSVKKRFPVKPRPVKKRPLKEKKRFPHKRGVELETPSFANTSSLVSEIDIPF